MTRYWHRQTETLRIFKSRPGMVAHAYNPNYLGYRDLKDCRGSRPAQAKVHKTPSQPMDRHSGTHQLYMEAKIGDCNLGRPRHETRPYPQNKQKNWKSDRASA
jgi:hypothetical protein